MPLMRNWTEITVDEDLLIPVLKELLALAIDPNHVEVSNGASGRVILVDVDLAEIWYQHMLKKDQPEEEAALDPAPEPLPADVVAELEVVPATIEEEVVALAATQLPEVVAAATGSNIVAVASNKDDDAATTSQGTEDLVPLPVKRGPGRPRKQTAPSASNGEDL